MSLASWRAEFYPVEAKEATGSALAAAEHSLRKWRGLRSAELGRHDLKKARSRIIGRYDELRADDATCALCVAFYDEATDLVDYDRDDSPECEKCPLSIVRGAVSCTTRREGEANDPYAVWVLEGDPEPMISWLEMAVAFCKQQAAVKSDESYEASEALLDARKV